MSRVIACLQATCLTMVIAACGPIAYVNDVTRRASDSVDAAQTAEADKFAPYYWTRAKEYLYKARERAAHADFQGANRFGRLAAEAAELAEQEAIAARKDPSKRPLQITPEVAPAKDVVPAKGAVPAKDDEAPVVPAKDQP
jgi:sRNA-binding protein